MSIRKQIVVVVTVDDDDDDEAPNKIPNIILIVLSVFLVTWRLYLFTLKLFSRHYCRWSDMSIYKSHLDSSQNFADFIPCFSRNISNSSLEFLIILIPRKNLRQFLLYKN